MELASLNRVGGWAVWGLLLLFAWTLPGQVWRSASAPEFQFQSVLLFLLLALGLALAALAVVVFAGAGLSRSRLLSLLEAPPALLWGTLVLALWPAAWGPPGVLAWMLAFLACELPTEVRWLAQALPGDHPFPAAWGRKALVRSRIGSLRTLAPPWLAARIPVWVMATLVLERMLGLQGLGSDWAARVAARDRMGVALWVAALALLWAVSRPLERRIP